MTRSTAQRDGHKGGRSRAAFAATSLFREIRERVPLCDDLAAEIVERGEGRVSVKPPARSRKRSERPE